MGKKDKEEKSKKKSKKKNGIAYSDKMCVTHEFRLSFPSLVEPQKPKKGKGEPRYTITMLFDEDVDLSKASSAKTNSLEDAIYNAKVEKWGKDEDEWPEIENELLNDGDAKPNWEGYAGTTYARAWTYRQPDMFRAKKGKDGKFLEIDDAEELYAGCYARAVVVAFAWEESGNAGVSLMLNSIQKLRDGEEFVSNNSNDNFDDGVVDDDDDEEDDRKSSKKSKKKSRDDDDDDDDDGWKSSKSLKTSKKKKSRDDDDDEEEDDEDEKPKKKSSKPSKKKKSRDDDDDDDDD